MDTSNHGSLCGCPDDDNIILILSNFQVVLTWKNMCGWRKGAIFIDSSKRKLVDRLLMNICLFQNFIKLIIVVVLMGEQEQQPNWQRT